MDEEGRLEAVRARVPTTGADLEARARGFLAERGAALGLSDRRDELLTRSIDPPSLDAWAATFVADVAPRAIACP